MTATGREHESNRSRPEISSSWQRSWQHGIAPESALRNITVSEVDAGSRLMVAARPVLAELTRRLEGTDFGVALTDRDCRIAFRWLGNRRLDGHVESIGFVLGARMDEERIGTNAMGTPHEVRAPLWVGGGEHFAAPLRMFSCYGHPIVHPLSGRLEGVLDITSPSEGSSPLFAALIGRAAADIRARLIDAARAAESRLLRAFQQATQYRSAPVAVLGGEVVLANRSCLDQLGPGGPAVLRALLDDLPERGPRTRALRLGEDQWIDVAVERVEGTRDGALFRLGQPRRRPGPVLAAEPHRDADGPVFIAGEPGTGRSTLAEQMANGATVVFDALSSLAADERAWADEVRSAAARDDVVPVVEAVHLLSERQISALGELMRQHPRRRIVCTACESGQWPPPVADLAARCTRNVDLAPLRERLSELPVLAGTMLRTCRGDERAQFSAAALDALRTHPWPGNLTELRAVVERIADRPNTGVVELDDLPAGYLPSSRARQLGTRELAERNAIIHALGETRGNKVRAANRLGMGRATLYRRMRALGISDRCLKMDQPPGSSSLRISGTG